MAEALLAGVLLAWLGLLALCLGLERHYRQVLGDSASPLRLRLLRLSGWLLSGLALYACSLVWGLAMGLVAWLGLLSLCGLALVLLLPLAPRLVLGLPLLGGMGWLLLLVLRL